jgi:biopolymer transport protein ExbD
MAKRKTENAELNLTPMIDVVFQLIIFFIVTIKMNEQINYDIILESAPHGPVVTEEPNPYALVVEVAQNGRISIGNVPMSRNRLKGIIRKSIRQNRGLPIDIMVRADYRALHRYVRSVMDACTEEGVWRINFVAVQEHKLTPGRHQPVPPQFRM